MRIVEFHIGEGIHFTGHLEAGKLPLLLHLLVHVFSLGIYVVSLLFSDMGKEDLELIFNPLSFCCMVLLESIGSAGLIRNENFQVMDAKKKTISPSGLLDIIVGVTSQEESVLIVTTNKPQQLYEAILRPGRIGSQIEFGKPRIAEIKQLFQLMYMLE